MTSSISGNFFLTQVQQKPVPMEKQFDFHPSLHHNSRDRYDLFSYETDRSSAHILHKKESAGSRLSHIDPAVFVIV